MAESRKLALLPLIPFLLPTQVLCLDGYWQGSALFRGQWRFMEAEFSESPQVRAKIDLPQQRHELKNFKQGNGVLEFTLQRGSSELNCRGTLRDDWIVGAIEVQSSHGAFQLRRVADRQFRRLADVLGTYRAGDGRLISVAKFGFGDDVERLSLLDSKIGSWGMLLHQTGNRFSFMPARYAPFPATMQVEFTLDASSAAHTVRLIDKGKVVAVASRVEPYREHAVRFPGEGVVLSGTLIKPASHPPHPAIVVLHSSGHQSRNGPVAYFRLLANFFAAQGIATLIYDKRGVGESTGEWATASFDDLAGDGLKAIEFLKSQADIDSKRIGLWGISQGGWLAPLAASRSSDVAFIVPVSGPAVGTGEQEIYRVVNWLRKEGFTSDEVTAAEHHMRLFFAVVDEKAGWDSLEASTKRARNSRWASFVQLPSSLKDLTWWMRMRGFDPAKLTAGLTCPSLHLFGSLDDDVPTNESARILASLPGKERRTVKVFKGADHFMLVVPKADTTGLMPVLSPGYLETMVAWVRSLTRR
ncbi:MAG: alpha/beta fold hydrolase [Acidimicrobiia bacterium]|nr:alpha/beta fold hydrolase [Acidimicrobiia bacterium]